MPMRLKQFQCFISVLFHHVRRALRCWFHCSSCSGRPWSDVFVKSTRWDTTTTNALSRRWIARRRWPPTPASLAPPPPSRQPIAHLLRSTRHRVSVTSSTRRPPIPTMVAAACRVTTAATSVGGSTCPSSRFHRATDWTRGYMMGDVRLNWIKNNHLTLWRTLLPYRYSYKASCGDRLSRHL